MLNVAIAYYGRSALAPNGDAMGYGTSAFRDDLVNNNQGGGVYQHLFGFIGLTMSGGPIANALALNQLRIDLKDARGERPDHTAEEGQTELRDDIAGINAGRAINDFLAGNVDAQQLGKNLRDLLCQ